MKSEREMNIEAIAGIIHTANWQEDYHCAQAYARHVNAANGWTFDVRSPNGWTRVESLRLSEEDLLLAVTLADLWSQGLRLEQREVPMADLDNEIGDPRMVWAIWDLHGKGAPYKVYRIINSNVPEKGWLLWCPATHRAGVALGGPVQWTDADSAPDALARWLGLGKAMCN